MDAPISPRRPLGASQNGTFVNRMEPSRRRLRFNQTRQTAPEIGRGRAAATGAQDTFESLEPSSPLAGLRHANRPPRSFRRYTKPIEVPEALRDPKTRDVVWEIEVEEGNDGSKDVVDCSFIASREELQRWRLNISDFHTLLTGGTEAIRAYRTEQRRKDLLQINGSERNENAQAVLDADEALTTALLAAAPKPATPSKSTKDVQSGVPAPREPWYKTVFAWPYRAIKALWQWFCQLFADA